VGEGAIVRCFGGIGRMDVTCKVGIIDYSVSGECGGGRDNGGKGKGRKRRKGEERKKKREEKIGGRERKAEQERDKKLTFGQNGTGIKVTIN
jgi:hypothetical protein